MKCCLVLKLFWNFTPPMTNLKTLRDWLRYACSRFQQADIFYGHGTDNALDEAYQLVFGLLQLPLASSELFLDAALCQDECQRLAQAIDQRVLSRVPVPYLTGQAWFCQMAFQVNEHTLIPRSPIGELIEQGFEPWLSQPPERVLDLCTGSGCIGIAVAHFFEQALVDLSDLSADAMAVAQRNIEQHQLSERVQVLASDLFASLPAQQYDLIVTNPPYVDAQDMADLPAEYLHEPRLALAAGQDGLVLVHRILADSLAYLQPDGLLICEVGNSAEALHAIYPEVPFVWLEFARGGDGVFLLSRADLEAHHDQFLAQIAAN